MRTSTRIELGVLMMAITLPLAGCSSDGSFTAAANLNGNYTVSVTNADNGCNLDNWETGKSTSDIPFLIEQNGTTVNGTLQGVAAIALGLSIGTNKFQGTSTGSDFQITAYGTIPRTQNQCTFTLNAAISGGISGDAISGTISYAPAASDNPDCASLQCTSTQNFNGTRPPSAQ